MLLLIAGTGPGSHDLISQAALNSAADADIILVPRSHENSQGIAENVIAHYFPHKNFLHITFPMTSNSTQRDNSIISQLEALRPQWERAASIFFPVLGDAMLFSTAKYLIDAFSKLADNLEIKYIPGISAHSLAAATAKKFLAMQDEIFTVIPGTAQPEKISQALASCDSAAVYKPTAIENPEKLFAGFEVIRVDYAGIPGLETITRGKEALSNITNYMSVLLLWRNC